MEAASLPPVMTSILQAATRMPSVFLLPFLATSDEDHVLLNRPPTVLLADLNLSMPACSKKAGTKRTTDLDGDSNERSSSQRDDGRITLASHASQRRGPVTKIASNV